MYVYICMYIYVVYIYKCVYTYIYLYLCVCLCVCVGVYVPCICGLSRIVKSGTHSTVIFHTTSTIELTFGNFFQQADAVAFAGGQVKFSNICTLLNILTKYAIVIERAD